MNAQLCVRLDMCVHKHAMMIVQYSGCLASVVAIVPEYIDILDLSIFTQRNSRMLQTPTEATWDKVDTVRCIMQCPCVCVPCCQLISTQIVLIGKQHFIQLPWMRRKKNGLATKRENENLFLIHSGIKRQQQQYAASKQASSTQFTPFLSLPK